MVEMVFPSPWYPLSVSHHASKVAIKSAITITKYDILEKHTHATLRLQISPDHRLECHRMGRSFRFLCVPSTTAPFSAPHIPKT
jgi:hypothetical protein